jgi:PmbA protein
MENINRIAELALGCLKRKGADKAQVDVGLKQTHELNVEAGRLSLLRTNFDQWIGMRAITDSKQAAMGGNQFEDQTIEELARQTLETAKTSQRDEAFDIAPMQSPQKFKSGPVAGDFELLMSRTEEFLAQAKERFPKVILEGVIVQFIKRQRVLANTNGVHFELGQSHYECSFMFTGKDGKKTSSFNYTGMSLLDLNKPIMKLADTETLLRQSGEQTEMKQLTGKFVGDIIVTPHCLPNFISGFLGQLEAGALLKGQSLYQEKINTQVATNQFTLRTRPLAPDFAELGFITSDGFVSRDTDIVDKGILKTFMLDQYGANKLKKPRAGSDDNYHVVDPGSADLKEMIRKVKKGLLLCRFSGGTPSSNGDISGVAKNSYYIENGEILYPVSEVMVSGNIPSMLMNIKEISKETLNFGSSKLPWMSFAGLNISGK